MSNLLAYLGCCLIWSSTWLFIKFGLESFAPFSFLSIRFLLAAPVLLGAAAIAREPLLPRSRNEWLHAAIIGFGMMALPYGLIYWGETRLPSGLTAVLFALQPIFAVVFAHFFLARERFRPAQLGGILLALLGILAVCRSQLHGRAELGGALAILISATGQGFMAVYQKKRGHHGGQFAQLGWANLIGGGLLLPALLLEAHPVRALTAQGVGSLLYLAVFGSAVAFVLVFQLFRNWEATKTSTISLVTPALALLWGWMFRHEPLGADYVLGASLIVLGTWQANRVRATPSKA
jgi:drug/metabolite transporter (DMT)-like permease